MKKEKIKNSQLGLTVTFIILCVLVVLPFLLVVGISLSNEKDIVEYGYSLIPKNLDFSAYDHIFKNTHSILNAYGVTALFSIISTFFGVLFMAMLANALAHKELKGVNTVSFLLYFTMLFSGGLVPSYILITQYLHLNDTIWVYVLPSLISPWYTFMIRTFFKGIPKEILESAIVDGANEYTIFFKFMLPLSKPVLASVALFVFLGKWNDWYTSMLYINKEELVSLQYLLQRIMNNIELLKLDAMKNVQIRTKEIPSETVRMAMAVIVAGPALVIFPFFQKYFVKGMTVGAVKG